MTSQADGERLRQLLASVDQLRFYRRGVGVPEGARPLNPENPECKWYVETIAGGRRRRELPSGGTANRGAWLLPLLRGQMQAVDAPELGATFLRPVMSLTSLHKRRTAREAWRAALPWTTDAVRQLNRSVSKILHVPRSTWTTGALGRSGVIGNAYDYAVGSVWAGDDLLGVFHRVRLATSRFPAVRAVFSALVQMLRKALDASRRGPRALPSDFYRGLVLLAELDAMSRAPVDPPRWISRMEPGRVTQGVLRGHLEENYPDEVAAELSDLLDATLDSLSPSGPVVYNPTFGGAPDLEHIGADGDLILDGKLFELKASTRPYTGDHLWQLLGYACLDRLHGRERIRRVSLFNPRRRHLWAEDLDRFVALLGGRSFNNFVQWFRETPAANGLDLIDGQPRDATKMPNP